MPVNLQVATPVLHVSNLLKSLDYYTSVLGFAEDFRFEDRYAGLHSGSVQLHLSEGGGLFNRPVGGSNVYFTLPSPADVDTFFQEISAKGAKYDKEPANYSYGMRDFVVFDPDNNMLTFGADTETQIS